MTALPSLSAVRARRIGPNSRPARRARQAAEAGGSLGEVLAQMVDSGRLSPAHVEIGQWFLTLLQSSFGSSGGITSAWRERVDGGTVFRSSPTGWTHAQLTIQAILDELRQHERRTLDWLILRREQERRSLADFGRVSCGYQDRSMAIAAAGERIRMLLESISEIRNRRGHRSRAPVPPCSVRTG